MSSRLGGVSGFRRLRVAQVPILGPGILLLATILIAPLPAQELTLHVDVKLVNVFVNVTDRNGAIVGGLSREDFAIAEDGKPQQIAVFERQSELP